MSRKIHPLGFRLNIDQLWLFPYSLSEAKTFQRRFLFLYLWIRSFCVQNYIYFIRLIPFAETATYSVLQFLFFSQQFFTLKGEVGAHSDRRRRTLLFRGRQWRIRKRTIRRLRLLSRRYSAISRLFYSLWFVPRGNFYSRSFRAYWRRTYFYWLRQPSTRRVRKRRVDRKVPRWRRHKTSAPRERSRRFRLTNRSAKKQFWLDRLRHLHMRLQVLRFKRYLESLFLVIGNRFAFLFIQNIASSGLVLSGREHRQRFRRYQENFQSFLKIRDRPISLVAHQEQFFCSGIQHYIHRYSFIRPFVSLTLYALMHFSAFALIQWLQYRLCRVRKHSVVLSHKKLLYLFIEILKRGIAISSLSRGFRFEVFGKIGGRLRSTRFRFGIGKLASRQSVYAGFRFFGDEVPTYAGAFSLRLWLIR